MLLRANSILRTDSPVNKIEPLVLLAEESSKGASENDSFGHTHVANLGDSIQHPKVEDHDPASTLQEQKSTPGHHYLEPSTETALSEEEQQQPIKEDDDKENKHDTQTFDLTLDDQPSESPSTPAKDTPELYSTLTATSPPPVPPKDDNAGPQTFSAKTLKNYRQAISGPLVDAKGKIVTKVKQVMRSNTFLKRTSK